MAFFSLPVRLAPLALLMLAACSSGPPPGPATITGVETYVVGGSISGLLAGETVTLQNNGGDDLSLGGNGTFSFMDAAVAGNKYAVTVSVQPKSPAQTCLVGNATGTVGMGNVTNIKVSCH
jgi:hypothetical protein